GHSRNLVRQISRGGGTDMFRTRQSTLDGHLPSRNGQAAVATVPNSGAV
ncbi:hypothetical protein ABIC08_006453, partial [Bradyrhizobium sp. RT9b]